MLSGRNLTSPRVEILFTPLKSLRPEPPPPDPLPIVPGKPGNYLQCQRQSMCIACYTSPNVCSA